MDIQSIERDLITVYRNSIWKPFMHGVMEYNLIEENDKIAVCISGGKDSLTLAKLIQEAVKHGPVRFEAIYIAMDPGFNDINRESLLLNCEKMGIPVQLYKTNIFEVVKKISNDYPCYMCARMRRGFLYDFAQKNGCNKIALGHHFDDVIETTLLNILYGGTYKTMVPKLKSENFSNMELIRPMTYVKENSIIRFMKHIDIHAMNCGCSVASGEIPSKRKEVKELINHMRKIYPNVDISIYRSAENVNLNCCLGWLKDDVKYNYLDEYEQKKEKAK